MDVAAYRIPTEEEESDGTLRWNGTTMIVVEITCERHVGLGYTYNHQAVALLINQKLRSVIEGRDPMCVSLAWDVMRRVTRNMGHPGPVSSAIAAVDIALWDLKARLLNVSLVDMLGSVRRQVPVYGSGGFTSYTLEQLQEQLGQWVEQGISDVKMKVGRESARDAERVAVAREAIGAATGLFVDANGAYDRRQALAQANQFATSNVTWFEEPVSSDDLTGLHWVRDRAPAAMEVTAGEYCYCPADFEHMLEAESVDVQMADATRCQGISGFLHAAALCEARCLPLSAHTAPTLHGHLGCCCNRVRHVEYFHDHVRLERMAFDGALESVSGSLRPDRSAPGLGLSLKRVDLTKYLVWN